MGRWKQSDAQLAFAVRRQFPPLLLRTARGGPLLRGIHRLLLIVTEGFIVILRVGRLLRPGRRLRRAGHAAEFGEGNEATQATPPDGTLVPEMIRILMSLRLTSEGI